MLTATGPLRRRARSVRQSHTVGDRQSSSPFALSAISLVALVLVVAFSQELGRWMIQPFSVMLLGSAVLLATLIRSSVRGQGHSLTFLIFVVLCLFHVGLYLQPAIAGTMPTGLGSIVYRSNWYTQASMVRAGIVVLLGLLGYSSAVGLVTLLRPSLRAHAADGTDPVRYAPFAAAVASGVGAAMLLVGVSFWWLISVGSLGWTFYLRDYLSYLDATSSQPLPVAYLIISVGAVLAAVHLRGRVGVVAMVAFLLFALPGFVIGLRGEVLIPVVAAIPVFFRDPRNHGFTVALRKPSVRIGLVAAVLMLLVGISLVQQIRLEGLQSLRPGGDRQISALAAVQEMGYTVRVVTTSLTWHEDLREPYRDGATYYTPLVRPAYRILGLPRADAETDYGLMNVEIDNRVGPIGGSMIAEAHHNFGRPGVVGFLAIVGLASVAIDRPRLSVWPAAWLGSFGLLALMHVRNSFAPMFAWAAAAALAICFAMAVSRLYDGRGRPRALS